MGTNGVIKYYTAVPKVDPQVDLNLNAKAEIVSEFSETFDIDALLNDADGSTPADVQNLMEDVYVPVESEGQVQAVNDDVLEQETIMGVNKSEELEDDAIMESDDKVVQTKSVKFGRKIVKTYHDGNDEMEFEDESDDDNFDNSEGQVGVFNKKMKLKLKHMKKMKRRSAKIDKNLAEAALNMMDIDTRKAKTESN